MYYVYILHSKLADKFYVGYTSCIEDRLEAHNHPKNKGWTARYKPWSLVYAEEFETKSEAMDRERKIKSYKNKEFIKKTFLTR